MTPDGGEIMTRIAVSIETLTAEVHARSPQTTIYHYDNDTARNSDHDPNSYGVICAADIMQGHGLDLHKLSREIVASRHPECAYVIYNKQIASRNTGWEWVEYHGESDHEDHIHVSVGVGPDGYKNPPYDSTRPWLGAVDMTPAEGYTLHHVNYITAGLAAMTDVIVVPKYTNAGQTWAARSVPNVQAVTIKAIGNPDVDEVKLAQELAAILGPMLEDALEPDGGLSAEEATAIVEDALNRAKIVVTPAP